MLLDELGKELVEGTSALVGGRTINIMNPDGVIVASTEPERIGSIHQGAREAARTGRVVNIYRDQLDRYPGAKEGCNMPLRLGGDIIGVVGIYGDPEKIQDVARLLELYATKYYQLEAMLRPRMAENVLRIRLLVTLISPTGSILSAAGDMLEQLNIRLQFPVATIVISDGTGGELSRRGDQLHHLLDQLGFLRKSCDLWGEVKDRMVLLCSACEERSIEELRSLQEEGFRVSVGLPARSLYEIQSAYDQASVLDGASTEGFNDMSRAEVRCRYLLCRTAGQEKEYLDEMLRLLEDTYGVNNCRGMLESAEAYYDCDRSVTQAARRKFIHKNTLQYRVKRIQETLGITDLSAFAQEYLIRLLLEHYHRKSGSQDLEK